MVGALYIKLLTKKKQPHDQKRSSVDLFTIAFRIPRNTRTR